MYQALKGADFLGSCLFFRTLNMDPKPIPSDIVDKGCKNWKEKSRKNHPLLVDVIKTFKGRVML